MVEKIISGGQTGADQGGLEAGRKLGLKTGGTAPMGWRTETGPQPNLLRSFGLVEAGVPGYPFRTKMNILNSDATVIFGDTKEPGSKLTENLCLKLKKPCFIITTGGLDYLLRTDKNLLEKFLVELQSNILSENRKLRWGLADFKSLKIFLRNVRVLNVAGNRESKNLGIQERVRDFLVETLKGGTLWLHPKKP